MDTTQRFVFTGVALTLLSAFFAVVGILIAIKISIIPGILIVVASTLFWGYTCLASKITEIKIAQKYPINKGSLSGKIGEIMLDTKYQVGTPSKQRGGLSSLDMEGETPS